MAHQVLKAIVDERYGGEHTTLAAELPKDSISAKTIHRAYRGPKCSLKTLGVVAAHLGYDPLTLFSFHPAWRDASPDLVAARKARSFARLQKALSADQVETWVSMLIAAAQSGDLDAGREAFDLVVSKARHARHERGSRKRTAPARSKTKKS